MTDRLRALPSVRMDSSLQDLVHSCARALAGDRADQVPRLRPHGLADQLAVLAGEALNDIDALHHPDPVIATQVRDLLRDLRRALP